MSTFIKPPLPSQDFVDADGLWDQRFGPYTKEDMQARDAELLRAVAEYLDRNLVSAREYADELRKAAEQCLAVREQP